MNLKSYIRTVPDFPKKGIMFRDVTTLMQNRIALSQSIDDLYSLIKHKKIDIVCGIESRGFIFGSPLALKLGCGFVPIRKLGKLPSETVSIEYSLEYGKDSIEMHKDAIKEGDNVLLVDDLIATGGTIQAAAKLVEKAGGIVSAIVFLIELTDLHGRDKLKSYDVYSLLEYEGE
jgi:adenine phosphoribosyltransferase